MAEQKESSRRTKLPFIALMLGHQGRKKDFSRGGGGEGRFECYFSLIFFLTLYKGNV